jgi:hypothetical protein
VSECGVFAIVCLLGSIAAQGWPCGVHWSKPSKCRSVIHRLFALLASNRLPRVRSADGSAARVVLVVHRCSTHAALATSKPSALSDRSKRDRTVPRCPTSPSSHQSQSGQTESAVGYHSAYCRVCPGTAWPSASLADAFSRPRDRLDHCEPPTQVSMSSFQILNSSSESCDLIGIDLLAC